MDNGITPMPEAITEIVFKNGMMMAVYGTRNEIHNAVNSGAVFVELEAYSVLNTKSKRAVYSIRTSEILMIGVERDQTSPAEQPLDLTEFFANRSPDGDLN